MPTHDKKPIDEPSVSVPIRALERDMPSLQMPWYGAALSVLAVVGLGVVTHGTPSPSPDEPSWESYHHPVERAAAHDIARFHSPRDSGPTVGASELVLHRRALLPADPASFAQGCEHTRWNWSFPRYTRDRLEGFLSASLDRRDQVDALLAVTSCAADGCAVAAPVPVVETLSAHARSVVYEELGRYDTNPQVQLCHRRSPEDGSFAQIQELPPASLPWIERMEFTLHGVRQLVDLDVVCAHLATAEERTAFMRAINARITVDASLRTTVNDDVMRNSVPTAARAEAMRRVEEARARGEAAVPLVEFLPHDVGARIGRYPSPSELDINCFSSALSYYGIDDRSVVTSRRMWARVSEGFVRVDDGSVRLGDLMVFEDAAGQAVHAANYLLGATVFTKNGFSPLEPWRVVTLADIRVDYPDIAHVTLWRRRD